LKTLSNKRGLTLYLDRVLVCMKRLFKTFKWFGKIVIWFKSLFIKKILNILL